ncbi:UNVERIFIED_ORG: hypothetical protein J2Y81_000761 [Paraburkholderia sediminicola]|nr:hypothetical protein [Paraburkholderia sediminicola]
MNHIRKTLALALITCATSAFAATIPPPSDSPNGGYSYTLNLGSSCASDFVSLPGPSGSMMPEQTCAYSPPIASGLCPAGSFTLDGNSCEMQAADSSIIYLGQAGSETPSTEWQNISTGGPVSSGEIASINSQITAAQTAYNNSNGTSSSASSISGIVSKLTGSSTFSDIVSGLLAVVAIILSLSLIYLGAKFVDNMLNRRALSGMKSKGAIWTNDRGFVDKNTWQTIRSQKIRAQTSGNYGMKASGRGSQNPRKSSNKSQRNFKKR